MIFWKPRPIFYQFIQPKSLATWRNVVLKIPTKWDFSRFLGQVFDWLSAVNRAKTCLQVLLHLSPEKRGSWQEFCMLTSSLGKLGIFSVSMLRLDCRERETDQQGADAGNPGSWQEFSMEWGWDLTSKRITIQAKRILFLFKIKWRVFFPVELLGQIQLVPSYVRSRVQAFFIIMSHLPPSNLHHWSKGSAVQWAPAGFFL